MKINAYLAFNGNCEAALAHYEKVFGVKCAYSTTYGENAGEMGNMPMSEEIKGKILHAYLPITEHVVIMACDVVGGMCDPVVKGNMIALNVSPNTEEEARRIFAELSEGGTVIMPLEKTFWNALYAVFEDKFGIQWMVNYNYE